MIYCPKNPNQEEEKKISKVFYLSRLSKNLTPPDPKTAVMFFFFGTKTIEFFFFIIVFQFRWTVVVVVNWFLSVIPHLLLNSSSPISNPL